MPRKKKEDPELFKFDEEKPKAKKPRKPRKKKVDTDIPIIGGDHPSNEEEIKEIKESNEKIIQEVKEEIKEEKPAELFDEADAITSRPPKIIAHFTASESQSRSRIKQYAKRRQ